MILSWLISCNTPYVKVCSRCTEYWRGSQLGLYQRIAFIKRYLLCLPIYKNDQTLHREKVMDADIGMEVV